jgi:hypothetical protein
MADEEFFSPPDQQRALPVGFSLTLEDFQRYWVAKTGTRTPSCSVCGGETWEKTVHLVEVPIRGQGLVYIFQPLICITCGNTLLINLDQVYDYLEQNPEGS